MSHSYDKQLALESIRAHYIETMISKKQLCYFLHFDAKLGIFIWRKRAGKASAGDRAGYIDNGYIKIRLLGKNYYAHRLAWLYTYGKCPLNQIDHINGNRSDNRIINLRDVESYVNCQNLRVPGSRNSSGYLGVSKNGKKFRAQIKYGGRNYWIGSFITAKAASDAYLAKKREKHFGCTV